MVTSMQHMSAIRRRRPSSLCGNGCASENAQESGRKVLKIHSGPCRKIWDLPHTNFAVESIEQTFNGTPGFNKKVSATISRNGDLISDVFVDVVLTKPAGATSTWWPAEALLNQVELEIGGQRIDYHTNTYLRVFNELFRKNDDKDAYERLVNFTLQEQASTAAVTRRFYVPLIFFFNRNPGLALPLIALTSGPKSILPRTSGLCARTKPVRPQLRRQMLVSCF